MSSLKVTKKEKEPSAMEQRNTAILNFALTALVPLLLCIILGFSLGHTQDQNDTNLFKKLAAKRAEYQQLKIEVDNLQKAFEGSDSLFTQFTKKTVPTLDKKLSTAEDEFDFNSWDRERKFGVRDFKDANERIERPLDFSTNEPLQTILTLGKKWLAIYGDTQNDAFFAQRLVKQQTGDDDMTTSLEQQIQELQSQLTLKETENQLLTANLSNTAGSSGVQIADQSKDIAKLQNHLDANMANMTEVKTAITTQLQEINSETLPSLQGKGFALGNTENKINQWKEKLKAKLTAIQIAVSDLN